MTRGITKPQDYSFPGTKGKYLSRSSVIPFKSCRDAKCGSHMLHKGQGIKKKTTPKNQQLKPWSSEPLTNSHRRQGGGQMRHRQNLFPCHPKAQQVTQAAEYRKGFQRQRKPGFESNPCYLLAARPGASYRSLPSPLLSYLQNGDGSVYLAQLFVDIKNCVK